MDSVLRYIKDLLETIPPAGRFTYSPPRQLIWDDDLCEYIWSNVEEIQMLVRGPIPRDIFVTIRFDDGLFKGNLCVDIYRLP
jgi:hypothetical protein